jgi:streptogramin lyase
MIFHRFAIWPIVLSGGRIKRGRARSHHWCFLRQRSRRGNLTASPDGSVIWHAQDKAVAKLDSKTGKLLERVPFSVNLNAPYDNIVTDDGNLWAGGSAAGGGDTIELMDTRTNNLLEVHSFSRDSTPARGGFDKDGNPGSAAAAARCSSSTPRRARSGNSGRRRRT